MNEFKFTTSDGKSHPYTWGPVVKTHEIGPYVLVEFHPMIFDGPCGTGRYHEEKVEFHGYIRKSKNQIVDTGLGYDNLIASVVGTIAYDMEGPNSKAAHYFLLMIGANE